MALSGLPHRVVTSLLDSTANWEWAYENLAASNGASTDNNAVFRTVVEGAGYALLDQAAGTYQFNNSNFYLDSADYALTGKTTQLRIRAMVMTNGTAPTRNWTVGLYPLTAAGGADTFAPTLGTVVTGSTVLFSAPSANTTTTGVSSVFAVPSAGSYGFGYLQAGGALANNAYMVIQVILQMNHV